MKGLTDYQRSVLQRVNADPFSCSEMECQDSLDEPHELDDIPQETLDNLTLRGLITWQHCQYEDCCYHYYITPTGRILLSVQSILEAR